MLSSYSSDVDWPAMVDNWPTIFSETTDAIHTNAINNESLILKYVLLEAIVGIKDNIF